MGKPRHSGYAASRSEGRICIPATLEMPSAPSVSLSHGITGRGCLQGHSHTARRLGCLKAKHESGAEPGRLAYHGAPCWPGVKPGAYLANWAPFPGSKSECSAHAQLLLRSLPWARLPPRSGHRAGHPLNAYREACVHNAGALQRVGIYPRNVTNDEHAAGCLFTNESPVRPAGRAHHSTAQPSGKLSRGHQLMPEGGPGSQAQPSGLVCPTLNLGYRDLLWLDPLAGRGFESIRGVLCAVAGPLCVAFPPQTEIRVVFPSAC